MPGKGLAYIISIPAAGKTPPTDDPLAGNPSAGNPKPATAEIVDYQATFAFQLEAVKPMEGIPVLTGTAAVQEISFSYDEAGWDIVSPTAVRIEPVEAATSM
ncbi:MAG: hypothetical protein QF437_19870, partial [Planctomycetota bacterium]|nr:hypothetical protein [Planctomycetota bacterium]